MKIFWTIVFLAASWASAAAQSGGDFVITQGFVASGGGHTSTGGVFAVSGTIGQPIAGTRSVNSPFLIDGGFWTNSSTATAAGIGIGGRVTDANGRGVSRAFVTAIDASGALRTALTNWFGYYRFEDFPAGETYLFTVSHKRLQFAPRAVYVSEKTENLDFTALP